MKHRGRKLAAMFLCAAMLLCGAAQAEIRVNEFPGIDAIPEHFELLADGTPPLPSMTIQADGSIVVTGLKAWGVAPEMMTDWTFAAERWSSDSSETYEDRMIVRAKREPNEYVCFPAVETEDCPAVMYLVIGNDYHSADPDRGSVSVEFRYKADGTTATLETDGMLFIERNDGEGRLTVWYDESGELMSLGETVMQPDGFGFLGDYEMARVTDCLTGEVFDEIIVTGEADPDAMRIRMAGEEVPRRIRIQTVDKLAFKEGDPALPVMDPLPADGLPEVWPAEYPDGFPEFSCEKVGDKYVWTVESLTGWGARVNIPGETYLIDDENYINYFWRSHTLDEVPEDRFRIVSEDGNGFFHVTVETEQGPYRMSLEGEAKTDAEGNPAPCLRLRLEIQEDRYIEVEYSSDGTTVRKKITTMIGGESVTGEYGEDNRLKQ